MAAADQSVTAFFYGTFYHVLDLVRIVDHVDHKINIKKRAHGLDILHV